MEEVEKDIIFFEESGGGVTLSGGEPLFQPDFAQAILRACRARQIHTTLDTCGYAPWETMQAVLDYTDLVLFDVKHLDPDIHREGTHADNTLIRGNFEKTISRNTARVWVRIPVIPGFNDTNAYFTALADIIEGKAEGTSVGGSFFLCMDPSHFGPLGDVLAKADRFAQAIEDSPARPGQRPPGMPGARGYQSIIKDEEVVEVLDSHWEPFFKTQAGRNGWTEESLRADWEAQR